MKFVDWKLRWDLPAAGTAALAVSWFAVGLAAGVVLCAAKSEISLRGREVASHQAHNLEVAGSTPAPANSPRITRISRKPNMEHERRRGCCQKRRQVSLRLAERGRPGQPAERASRGGVLLFLTAPAMGTERSLDGIKTACRLSRKAGSSPAVSRYSCCGNTADRREAKPAPVADLIKIMPLERWVLDGLWTVETDRGRNNAPGDGGAARGHLQQHEGHWRRGCEYLGVTWPWPQDAYDFEKAQAIAVANWRRDAWPKLQWLIAEYLARHFRLPNDPYRPDNDEYWRKVVHELRELHGKELTAEIAEVQR